MGTNLTVVGGGYILHGTNLTVVGGGYILHGTNLTVVGGGYILHGTETQLWSLKGVCPPSLVIQVAEVLRGN